MTTASGKNYYETLGISSEATETVIKSAYRKLARQYHPDVNGNNDASIKKFKEISEAYEVLTDADKKKNYDILRGFYKYGEDKAKQAQANKAYKETVKEEPKKEPFSHVFNDILDGIKKQKKEPPKRGTDVNADITITLAEANNGATRTINILHSEVCPNCQGRKFINGSKCPLCKGTGEQSLHKTLAVKIPPKVKHGSKIRIANEGNKGYNGGKNGDLYLNIKIESNALFKYDGINILYNVPITPFEAVLGASISIPTMDGNVNMKVMPNTSNGQKYRLAKQGLKKDGEIGDMIVTVHIEVPKAPTAEETELYEKLKKASTHDIRENILNGI